MILTEPILLGPTVIAYSIFVLAALSIFMLIIMMLKSEIKHLTKSRLFGTLFKWSQTMNVNDVLNLPVNKLTVPQTEAFQKARQAAIAIGSQVQFVTVDDVYFRLEKEGISASALGPAAGSIFRNKAFKPTELYVKSRRPSNRSRRIRTYLFVG